MDEIYTRHESIQRSIRRKLDKETYRKIRRLWMAHSIAEDARDIPGLIETLSTVCAYEVPMTGNVWRGHKGAEAFYNELFAAFPDAYFDLQNIVIGPQGVWEEAWVTGTWMVDWIGYKATGKPIGTRIQIFFPWNEEQELFDGERVYVDLHQLTQDTIKAE